MALMLSHGKDTFIENPLSGNYKKKEGEFSMKKDFLPFSLPLIEDEEKKAILEVLESGWITTGPKVKQFEEEFATFIGSRHAIAVNSCTAALHLSLDAIGISEGDEVITTPMTFAATAEVVRYFRARPVFVDIEPDTMNLDATKVEAIVNKKGHNFKAIIPVHYGGLPCNMDAIMDIARKHKLKVIEDAAHAFPATYKGRMVGTIGDITCFSFYATKTMTTGEGGMITTDNDEYAERMRVMSLHGINKDAWKRYTNEGSWYYEIIAPGYKYNLTDIAAALGVVQLKKAESMRERREEIASRYDEAFKDLSAIEIPPRPSNSNSIHSRHLYVIRLNLESITIDRNKFIDELNLRGIGTSVHFIPLHIHPYYREIYGFKPEDFPVAYETYKRIISLPIYPKMEYKDIARVVESVTDVAKRFKR
jgi:perosamine synthetase